MSHPNTATPAELDAMFEFQCATSNISPDAHALRNMMRTFFDAGVHLAESGVDLATATAALRPTPASAAGVA